MRKTILLPFIIAGLTTGSVYALAAVGLVLTYKTSGVFNFGHGALATISAYLFYSLHTQHGMAWPLAAVICVLVAGPVLGYVMELIARSIATASLATRVVTTVGILLLVQAAVTLIYGTTQTRQIQPFLPTHAYEIGGAVVSLDRIIVFAIGAGATAALYAFFRLTRTGTAMRAVVDDPGLLGISGTSPVRVRRWAWMIGVTFASVSGLLLAPFISLDSITLTFLVVAAFGAAALGGFSSLPITYVGGLVIGVGAALASKYFTTGILTGLSSSVPFLVLFVVLLVAPRRRLVERTPVVSRGQAQWSAPWSFQALFIVPLIVFLCFVPNFAGIHLTDWSRMLAMTILFLSLGLLVRTSGQVSLCHVSFMAIGVSAFSHLAVDHHWPWLLALLVSGLIAVPVGALLSIPAIRLSGLYLALATFGFGILLQYMFYSTDLMFGENGLGLSVPMPRWRSLGLTGSDKSYFYLCLVFAVVVAGLLVAISRSRLGRLSRALADSPRGLATSGTSTNVTRVLVFCLSAFLAAIAGALAAGAIGQTGGDSYLPINSLLYFAAIIIVLGGIPWYALTAAAGLTLIPSYVTSPDASNWIQLIFGVFAILFAVIPAERRGAHPALIAAIDKVFRRRHVSALKRVETTEITTDHVARAREGFVEAVGIGVSFGGLVAVDGVSLKAPTGRITGLIGPNGAGKTTTFNALSGLNRPNRGDVMLDGARVSGFSAARRARLGLGRTFQQMELFDNLTVWENVALGAEASKADANALRHLASSPRTARYVRERAAEAIKACDLEPLVDRMVGSLSTGQRRLVELARCLAGPFHILLLDEPSSGLDRVETARFGEVLQNVVADRQVGILLVEHDMVLVTDVCDYIYVLDFGELIFEGRPADVMSSPVVQAAYLGEDAVSVSPATAVIPQEVNS